MYPESRVQKHHLKMEDGLRYKLETEIYEECHERNFTGNTSFIFPKEFRQHSFVMEVNKIAGFLPLHDVRGVYLPPGEKVEWHLHASMRVFLYMLHDHECRLEFRNPDISYPTHRNTLVEIPEQVQHAVTLNETENPRYTIAVMYDITERTRLARGRL